MRVGFLEDFTAYGEEQSDAPRDFWWHAGLATLAAAIGPRIEAPGYAGKTIRPNLWVALLAPSGFGKSGPLFLAESVLRGASLDRLLLHDDFTQEALIVDLAGIQDDDDTFIKPNAQRLIIAHELSAFISTLHRTYNEGADRLITALYDNPATHRFLRRGGKGGQNREIVVTRPMLSILGASTIDWFVSSTRNKDAGEMFLGGFMSRFVFSFQDQRNGQVDTPREPDLEREGRLSRHVGIIASQTARMMDVDVLRDGEYAEWARAKRDAAAGAPPLLGGITSRAPVLAIKAAILHQASDNPTAFAIDKKNMRRGMVYVDNALANAQNFIEWQLPHNKADADVKTLMAILRANGKTMDYRRFFNASHFADTVRFERALASAAVSGYIFSDGEEETMRRTYTLAEVVE